jgi:hypothetical protein
MKCYVLYYENESGDRYVDGVLNYMPTKEDLIKRYKGCRDTEDHDDTFEEEDMLPELFANNCFSWGYMSCDIKEMKIETKEWIPAVVKIK